MASVLADPTGGSSGARLALLLEGRGLLQLLVRPPTHDSYTQTRAWIRARARTHTRTNVLGLEFNVNIASSLQTRPRWRPLPALTPRDLGSRGPWA